MFRIRFHGRGGQGMKTASRILGSTAFHAGFIVQDSPVYGAERRGAPMAAFTRIGREPIRERGTIVRPDLVVVADDTLLTDVAAQPLSGCDDRCTVLLNSTKEGAEIKHLVAGRWLQADCTALALEYTQTLVGVSTALGVAAACLIGLSFEDTIAGLNDELRAQLTAPQYVANGQLAHAVYALAQTWEPLRERPNDTVETAAPLVEVPFDPVHVAVPSIYTVGNSPQRKTGNWRQFRPVLHPALCTRCWICFVRCPEAAITLDAQEYPVVDYDECKGCLLCAHECPTHAFSTEKEMR